MRRHEKRACGGVVDVTLLSLPFLLEDDDEEEEVKSSSSVDTSILYTENCNVYTPHFTLRPEGEHTSVLCHRLFFLFVFDFCFCFSEPPPMPFPPRFFADCTIFFFNFFFQKILP